MIVENDRVGAGQRAYRDVESLAIDSEREGCPIRRLRRRQELQQCGDLRARTGLLLQHLPAGLGRSAVDREARQNLAVRPPLIRAEEESLVFYDRAADCAAELVLNPERRAVKSPFSNAIDDAATAAAGVRRLVQVAAGVQAIVVMEPESGAVQAVGAGLGHDVEYRAGGPPVFGRELV